MIQMPADAAIGCPTPEGRAEGGDEPDLLAALADGLAADAPPPPPGLTSGADPARAQATSRGPRQGSTAVTGRLPAPSTAGADRAEHGVTALLVHAHRILAGVPTSTYSLTAPRYAMGLLCVATNAERCTLWQVLRHLGGAPTIFLQGPVGAAGWTLPRSRCRACA